MFSNVYYDEYKGKMHLWEVNEHGKVVHTSEDHVIEYYIEDKSKTSPIKDIFGTPVVKRTTESRKKLKELRKSRVKTFESDLSEEVKYLHNRYKDIEYKPKVADYKVANIDIEIQCSNEFPKPELAKYPINLITIDFYRTDEIVTLGLNEYEGEFLNRPNFKYIHCKNEHMLLSRFCDIIKKEKVQIITGWNISGFDIPYICNRIENLGISEEACLSSLGRVIKKRNGFQIPGLAILDLMELYKKFSYQNQSSYSLNYIGLQEVGEGKLDFEGQINDLWARDWTTYVDYNIQDCFLVRKIEKKRKFIDLVINLCTQTRTPFERVYSTISIVEGYMLRYLHRDGVIFPDLPLREHSDDDTEEETIEGGYVEAHPGFYNFLLSIDATSLYPSNMRMFNISPETKVLNPSDIRGLIKTPIPGLFYRREAGYLPKIVTDIFNERKRFQAEMNKADGSGDKDLAEYYDAQQLIRKILINSMYGVLCNRFFHFYDLDNASAVTAIGREAIQYIANCSNTYFKNSFPKIVKNYYPNSDLMCQDVPDRIVRVIDTDSNYLWFQHIYLKTKEQDQTFLDWSLDFEERIFNPFLVKCMDIFASRYNTANLIHFKREKIIIKQYVQAKKKYVTQIIANEKKIYDTPVVKITGIEINKSDLCGYSRKKLKTLIEIMLSGDEYKYPNKDEMLAFIRSAYKEFKKQKIQDISAPKGVKDYDKYSVVLDSYYSNFLPSTPIHNRASIVYNHIIKTEKLPYMEVSNGTKMKYVFVNLKNKYKTNVIGYVGNYPKEFNQIFKIDYDEQFEKQFNGIAQRMFDTLGFGMITLKDSKLVSLIEEE